MVITATEFAKSPIKYYEAATKDSVFVKYAENYIKLVLAKRLPRVRKSKNPNNPSPSGDVWFDNPKNMTIVREAIESSENAKPVATLRTKKDIKTYIDSL
jgi:hypothetical protein